MLEIVKTLNKRKINNQFLVYNLYGREHWFYDFVKLQRYTGSNRIVFNSSYIEFFNKSFKNVILDNLSVSNDGSSCLSFKKTGTSSSDVVVDFSGMNDWDNKVFIAANKANNSVDFPEYFSFTRGNRYCGFFGDFEKINVADKVTYGFYIQNIAQKIFNKNPKNIIIRGSDIGAVEALMFLDYFIAISAANKVNLPKIQLDLHDLDLGDKILENGSTNLMFKNIIDSIYDNLTNNYGHKNAMELDSNQIISINSFEDNSNEMDVMGRSKDKRGFVDKILNFFDKKIFNITKEGRSTIAGLKKIGFFNDINSINDINVVESEYADIFKPWIKEKTINLNEKSVKVEEIHLSKSRFNNKIRGQY